jgi:hypothetical protein
MLKGCPALHMSYEHQETIVTNISHHVYLMKNYLETLHIDITNSWLFLKEKFLEECRGKLKYSELSIFRF